MSYYNVLGIEPTATTAQIRAAFRRKAKREHPDAHPNLAGAEREAQQRRFVRLVQAYEILSDPGRRRTYDATQRPAQAASAGRSRPASAAPEAASGPRARRRGPPADDEPGLEDLLRDVEGRLRAFGLDLRQPVEVLLEMMLDWAREIYRQVLASDASSAASERPGSTGRTSEARKQPRARPQPRPAAREADLEAELRTLKQQVRRQGRRAAPAGQDETVEAELRRIKARSTRRP